MENIIRNIYFLGKGYFDKVETKSKTYAILYPTDGYYLYEKQFDKIKRVSLSMYGENNLINFDIEFLKKEEEINTIEKRIIKRFDFESYKRELLLFENVLLESNYNWGIVVFQDYWAILYGEVEFVEKVALSYDFEKNIMDFYDEILAGNNNSLVYNKYLKFLKKSYEGILLKTIDFK